MADTSADDIESQVYDDAENGVQSFSDGTNSFTAVPLADRLDVASRKRRETVASSNPNFGLRNTQIISPAGGFR